MNKLHNTSATEGRYWVCWSFRQNCPHIESVTQGLWNNARAFMADRPVDYVPIGEFDSQESANEFLKTVQGDMRRRYDAQRDQRDALLHRESPSGHED